MGFLLGWLAGILVAVGLFTLLSSVLPQQDSSGSSPVSGRSRSSWAPCCFSWQSGNGEHGLPRANQPPCRNGCLPSIPTAIKGLGLGFLLSAVNPKNLLLGISAGVIIGDANLSLGDAVVVIVVFALVAGCSVLIPVVGYLIASARMAGPLDGLRQWLVDNNAAVMAVLLLVIGVAVIGKGIASF